MNANIRTGQGGGPSTFESAYCVSEKPSRSNSTCRLGLALPKIIVIRDVQRIQTLL
jgi:hypothetical protein